MQPKKQKKLEILTLFLVTNNEKDNWGWFLFNHISIFHYHFGFSSTDPMSTLDLGSDVKIKGTIWASSFIAHGVLGALISALLVTGKDMNE